MKDHASPGARLAAAKPIVAIQQPSWTLELLCLLCLVLAIAWSVAMTDLALAQVARADLEAERDGWKELALAPPAPERAVPTVRVEPHGNGFKCLYFNVRREWEKAVAAECEVMGALLHMARASK